VHVISPEPRATAEGRKWDRLEFRRYYAQI